MEKSLLKRGCIMVVGLIITQLGVSLFIRAGLGSDPFSVFVQGWSRLLGLSFGTMQILICIALIVVLWFVGRSYVKPGTILCMLLGGPLVDGYLMLHGLYLPETLSFFCALLLGVLGCVLCAFGMSIVIESNVGTGPNDLVAVILSDYFARPFAPCRIGVDLGYIVIGWLLGGTVGVGTILAMALIGPIAQVLRPRCKKQIDHLLIKP